jgi:hypothetical protein
LPPPAPRPTPWFARRREENALSYDAARVAAYYDQLGHAKWDRWERSLGDRISLVLHTEAVERAVPRGSRVLEIVAGPGRFTEVLHRLGCRIVYSTGAAPRP